MFSLEKRKAPICAVFEVFLRKTLVQNNLRVVFEMSFGKNLKSAYMLSDEYARFSLGCSFE